MEKEIVDCWYEEIKDFLTGSGADILKSVESKDKTVEEAVLSAFKVGINRGAAVVGALTTKAVEGIATAEDDSLILYEISFDGFYCRCMDEKSLLQYAIDGGWDSIEDLEESTGVSRKEILGKWFLITSSSEGSRVFTK